MTWLVVGFVTIASLWTIGAVWLVDPASELLGWHPDVVAIGHGLVFVVLTAGLLWRSLSWYLHQHEATTRRWEDLASTTREGLLVAELGDRGRIVYVNRALEQLTGHAAEEFQRDPTLPFQIVAEEDAGRLRSLWLSPLSQEWPLTLRINLPDGSSRLVEISGSVSEERTGLLLFQGIVVDVTAQERGRSTMQAAEAEMARVVAARDGLLTAMSHELRTPLTVVSGWAQTLQRHRGRMTRAQQLRAETAIWEHSQRLSSLVDDLLQLDRSGPAATVPSLAPCDAGQVVAAAVAASGTGARVKVTVPECLPVRADREQLRRIVHELLRNVEKYAPTGSVEVRVTEGPPGWWELQVADHGPGLPAGAERDALQAFARYDEAHPSPGAGLGLALVDRFVAAHGGRIGLVSEDGLRVSISMPVAPEPVRPQLRVIRPPA